MARKTPISFFGKKNINKIKKSFIDNNDKLVSESKDLFTKTANIGFSGKCNVCSSALNNAAFSKHGIKYYRCAECGMLGTGKVNDYNMYNALLYQTEDYGDYLGFESERLQSVYLPKVDYLIKILPDVLERGVIDIGAGLGYFVKALSTKGIPAKGYEINKEFVKKFNIMADPGLKGALIEISHDELISALENEDTNQVISLIGVLEHVEDPVFLLESIRNIGFKNIFISVPMFGISTYFEAIFGGHYHRQLSPDHIYLYSDKTLLWLERKLNFERLSEWYFGQDMYDISRILQTCNVGFDSEAAIEMFDEMQFAIDRNKLSSEVHLIWKC